jgi:hypothetical protein
MENTSVSENRKTGAKSPTVHFINFAHLKNNRFIAACQFKIRILGTDRHIIPDIVLLCSAAKRLEARSKKGDKVAAKIAAMRTNRDNFTTLQS